MIAKEQGYIVIKFNVLGFLQEGNEDFHTV
jgi:hypothetical protein